MYCILLIYMEMHTNDRQGNKDHSGINTCDSLSDDKTVVFPELIYKCNVYDFNYIWIVYGMVRN